MIVPFLLHLDLLTWVSPGEHPDCSLSPQLITHTYCYFKSGLLGKLSL